MSSDTAVSKCVSLVAMSIEIACVSSSSCPAPVATDVSKWAGAGPSSRGGLGADEASKQPAPVSKGVDHGHGHGVGMSNMASVRLSHGPVATDVSE